MWIKTFYILTILSEVKKIYIFLFFTTAEETGPLTHFTLHWVKWVHFPMLCELIYLEPTAYLLHSILLNKV